MGLEWLEIFEKSIWYGVGALGFAILFNVPPRTLGGIFLLAVLGGATKSILFYFGSGMVLSTLGGATLIGILSIQAAHIKHAPHVVFSIPSVIPMVPGLLAYRMMIGLVKLVGDNSNENYSKLLMETSKSALAVAFISMALVIGVGIPFFVTRKPTAKYIRFTN